MLDGTSPALVGFRCILFVGLFAACISTVLAGQVMNVGAVVDCCPSSVPACTDRHVLMLAYGFKDSVFWASFHVVLAGIDHPPFRAGLLWTVGPSFWKSPRETLC